MTTSVVHAVSMGAYRTTSQLHADGYSRRALRKALANGAVTRTRHGLYLVDARQAETAWQLRVQQAVAQSGRGAVVDRYSAARLLGIAGGPAATAITIAIPPHRSRPTAAPGIDFMRAKVAVCDRTSCHGMPTTTVLRTVVDCGRFGDRVSAVCLIESAVRRGDTTLDAIYERLATLKRSRGVTAVRAALALVDLRSESPLETAVRLAILDAGLPHPIPQLPFQAGRVRGRIDLAYPAELLGVPSGSRYVGLAIEADGREPHLQEETFDHDRVRQTALEEAGWLVRRFTDRHARQSPDYVAAVVGRALQTVRRG